MSKYVETGGSQYLRCGRKSCFANSGSLCRILIDYPDGKSEDDCVFYKDLKTFVKDKESAAKRLAKLTKPEEKE